MSHQIDEIESTDTLTSTCRLLSSHLLSFRDGTLPLPLHETSFWILLHSSLRGASRDASARRLGCVLLRIAIDSLDIITPSIQRKWDCLLLMLDAICDQPLHSLLALWIARGDELLPAIDSSVVGEVEEEVNAADSFEPMVRIPTSLDTQLPIEWLLLPLEGLLEHEMPATQRVFILRLLRETINAVPPIPLADAEIAHEEEEDAALRRRNQNNNNDDDNDSYDDAEKGEKEEEEKNDVLTQGVRALSSPPVFASLSGACTPWDGTGEMYGNTKIVKTPQLLRLPAWFVLGKGPLPHALASGAAFGSGAGGGSYSSSEATTRSALTAYLVAPKSASLRASRMRLAVSAMESVMGSKPTLRALLSASIDAAPAPPTRAECALGAKEIAILRIIVVRVTHISSRHFAGTIAASAARLVLRAARNAPPSDVALLIALVPSAAALPLSPGSPGGALALADEIAHWLLVAEDNVDGGESLITSAISQYLSPNEPRRFSTDAATTTTTTAEKSTTLVVSPPSTTPWTAASLSRFIGALPLSISNRVLIPVSIILNSSASPYAPMRPREHALLLLGALIAAGAPHGGAGDAHLARGVRGSQVAPDVGSSGPLRIEFESALRNAAAAWPMLPAFNETLGSAIAPAPPLSDDLDGGGGGGGALDSIDAWRITVPPSASPRSASASVTLLRAVASELAPSLGASLRASNDCTSFPDSFLLSLLCAGIDATTGESAYKNVAIPLALEAFEELKKSTSSQSPLPLRAAALQRLAALVSRTPLSVPSDFVATLLDMSPLRGPGGAEINAVGTAVKMPELRAAAEVWRWTAIANGMRVAAAAAAMRDGGLAARITQVASEAVSDGGTDESATPAALAALGMALSLVFSPLEGSVGEREEERLSLLNGAMRAADTALRSRAPRRVFAAATAVLLSPSLLLRPELAGTSTAPLTLWLRSAITRAAAEDAPSGALAALSARLGASLSIIATIGDAAFMRGDVVTSSNAIATLSIALPSIIAITLSSGPNPVPWDAASTIDDASRSALSRWLTARDAVRRQSEKIDTNSFATGPAPPDQHLHDAYLRAQVLGLSTTTSISFNLPGDVDAGALAVRGASGCLARVSILIFLEELGYLAERARARARACSNAFGAPSCITLRAAALSLASLHSSSIWSAVTPAIQPGRPLHIAKLRAWQALVITIGGFTRCGGGEKNKNNDDDSITMIATADAADAAAMAVIESGVLVDGPTTTDGEVCGSGSALALATAITAAQIPLANSYGDAAVARALLLLIFSPRILSGLSAQLPSLRHYAEITCVALSRQFPAHAARVALLPALRSWSAPTQAAFAAVLVAGDTLLTISRSGVVPHIARELFRALLPWVASPTGLLRVVAAHSLALSAPFVLSTSNNNNNNNNNDTCCDDLDATGRRNAADDAIRETLSPLLEMLDTAPDVRSQRRKAARALRRVAPARATTLVTLLSDPVSEHGDFLPRDTISYVLASFRAVLLERHAMDGTSVSEFRDPPPEGLSAAVRAGLAPVGALCDARLAWPFGAAGLPVVVTPFDDDSANGGVFCDARLIGVATALAPRPNTEAQRKLAQFAHRTDSSQASAAVLTRTSLMVNGSAVPRRNQPLIIFASLVDKAPNLGGLARTAEIFSAEALVVDTLKVLSDPLFSFTSLDAEKLLPVVECPVARARDYLRAQRSEGWSVVALEQAENSQVLGAGVPLPEKMILLLGAEMKGVPPELLAEADVTIEIPQLGTLRSLNVHVSAALVVWEYTRQRLASAREQGN
jgi:tRNA guanosine-2'-O-methyltransferase